MIKWAIIGIIGIVATFAIITAPIKWVIIGIFVTAFIVIMLIMLTLYVIMKNITE